MKITKITNIIKAQKPNKATVPEKGYYAKLHWMWGDADGYDDTIVGPFPDNRKDLFIEFLNVVEEMFLRYHNKGKGGYDDYESVPGYENWFDPEGAPGNDPDNAIRDCVGAELPDTAYAAGCVPELTGWKAIWHDGDIADEYPVRTVDANGAEIEHWTET